MPLPKPRTNERESDFLDRCITDVEVQREFSSQDQRLAVCASLYRPVKKASTYDVERFKFGFERKRDILERNYSRKFARYYYSQYQKGIEQFLQTNHINEIGIFSYPDIEDLMVGMFTGMGLEFAAWYFRNVNRFQIKSLSSNEKALLGIWEQQFLDYAKIYSASKIKLIQGTALGKLKMITRALMGDPDFMSKGVNEKARILNNKFKQISRWQAKRIVKTEGTTISNYAINQSAITMFPKEQLLKQWITTMDGWQRDAHGAVNKQEKPYDEPFIVNGEAMHTAGESTASPANRVNCRCVVVMYPKPDEYDL